MNNTKKQHWYKSPWLLGWLFLLLTVMSVNAYMIMQSINDFPGLVVDDFYERGQDYEENIATKLKNNQRWKTQFIITDVHLNQPTQIIFSITDKDNKAVKVEKITLFAYRPADASKDFSLPLVKIKGNNKYQATLSFNQKGKWDLLASIVIDGVEVNYPQKIFVKD